MTIGWMAGQIAGVIDEKQIACASGREGLEPESKEPRGIRGEEKEG